MASLKGACDALFFKFKGVHV